MADTCGLVVILTDLGSCLTQMIVDGTNCACLCVCGTQQLLTSVRGHGQQLCVCVFMFFPVVVCDVFA